MEGSLTPELDTKESSIEISKPETQASKRRKVIEKTVVTVKIEGNGGKQKNEGPPSDFWSWRKYGQKPIKGSPYPRGYYRCSTSKGCSAKKQVERSRTDASLLIITYTSTHNHPGPDLPTTTTTTTTNSTLEKENPQIKENPIEETPNQEQQQQPSSMGGSDEETSSEEHFYYLQSSSKDIMINTSTMNQNPFSIDFSLVGGLVFDEHPLSYHHHHHHHPTIPTKSEEKENDFFDELEELPISSSSFNSFMRTSLFDERILLQPS